MDTWKAWTTENKRQQRLTHLHVPLLSIGEGFTPGGQGVDGHNVRVELTVGVGEDASQFGDQLRGAILTQKMGVTFSPYEQTRTPLDKQHGARFYFVGPQEEPLGIVVVGVDVVPDDRSSPQHR